MNSKIGILSLERKCQKKTSSSLNKHLILQKKLLNFYIVLTNHAINGKKHAFDEQDLAIFLVNLNIIDSMSSSLILMRKGYYNDAFRILRTIQESKNLSLYFMNNDKAAARWIEGEKIPPREVKSALSATKSDRHYYSALSDFIHSNFQLFGGLY